MKHFLEAAELKGSGDPGLDREAAGGSRHRPLPGRWSSQQRPTTLPTPQHSVNSESVRRWAEPMFSRQSSGGERAFCIPDQSPMIANWSAGSDGVCIQCSQAPRGSQAQTRCSGKTPGTRGVCHVPLTPPPCLPGPESCGHQAGCACVPGTQGLFLFSFSISKFLQLLVIMSRFS